MRRQSGFTIIEIIIVVIILGLLASTALPRFLNVTEQAEDASIDGIAGGFASAVGMVRGQWEVQGRPKGNFSTNSGDVNMSFVSVDGTQIGVNGTGTTAGSALGFPTMKPTTGGDSRDSAMTDAKCLELLTLILQSSPSAITGTATSAQLAQNALYVREGAGTGPDNFANVCFYIQTAGLTAVPAAAATESLTGLQNARLNGFYYNPATGEVRVFKNKI